MKLPIVLLERRANLRHFFWLHPEWWSAGICALAWALLLWHGVQPTAHELHDRPIFTRELSSWMLMVAAMMLPLANGRVRATAAAGQRSTGSTLWTRWCAGWSRALRLRA